MVGKDDLWWENVETRGWALDKGAQTHANHLQHIFALCGPMTLTFDLLT